MGILSNIKAMKDIQKLQAGGTAYLSYAQVTNLIINLPDAQRNLNSNQFNAIYSLFRDLQNSSTKYEVDLNGYYAMAVDIIESFDGLAPYEYYSGASTIETRKLLELVRNK